MKRHFSQAFGSLLKHSKKRNGYAGSFKCRHCELQRSRVGRYNAQRQHHKGPSGFRRQSKRDDDYGEDYGEDYGIAPVSGQKTCKIFYK